MDQRKYRPAIQIPTDTFIIHITSPTEIDFFYWWNFLFLEKTFIKIVVLTPISGCWLKASSLISVWSLDSHLSLLRLVPSISHQVLPGEPQHHVWFKGALVSDTWNSPYFLSTKQQLKECLSLAMCSSRVLKLCESPFSSQ